MLAILIILGQLHQSLAIGLREHFVDERPQNGCEVLVLFLPPDILMHLRDADELLARALGVLVLVILQYSEYFLYKYQPFDQVGPAESNFNLVKQDVDTCIPLFDCAENCSV